MQEQFENELIYKFNEFKKSKFYTLTLSVNLDKHNVEINDKVLTILSENNATILLDFDNTYSIFIKRKQNEFGEWVYMHPMPYNF